MLYTHANTTNAKVFDVDTKEEFRKVIEVCPDEGWITVHKMHGIEFVTDGELFVTERIYFRSIHAIKGKERIPCLFHCYGRVS